MKIAHFADIHWRGLSRHEEYTYVFNQVFSQLNELKPDLIILAGDYFHTKTNGISPEVVSKITWMLRSMASIAPVHMILGNHDGNLGNENREDIISTIVSLLADPRINLYKQSGTYSLPSQFPCLLHIFSCFDKTGWDGIRVDPHAINLAAFHGSVKGSKTDIGWTFSGRNAEVDLGLFKGQDFVFLGDIHKKQFLAERTDKNGQRKGWIAYPGSIIQQNFGEESEKGFLFWEINSKEEWNVDFHPVLNPWSFISISYSEDLLEEFGIQEPQAKRFKILSNFPLPYVQKKTIRDFILNRFSAEIVVFESKNVVAETASSSNLDKQSQKDNISVLFGKFLSTVELQPTSEERNVLVATWQGLVEDTLENRKRKQEESQARDTTWVLHRIEFDNLFSYGKGNVLDFDTKQGLVGLFGKNRVGKSSVIGAIIYALFNGSDRSSVNKPAFVINKNSSSCSAKIWFSTNGRKYLVERETAKIETKKTGEKIETKVQLWDVTDEPRVSKSGTSRDETDKIIRSLIGSMDDLLLTSVATQSQMERFVNEGSSARKDILSKFLDLAIFDEMQERVVNNLKTLSAKKALVSQLLDEEKLNSDLCLAIAKKQDLESTLEELQSKKQELQKALSESEANKAIHEMEMQLIRNLEKESSRIALDVLEQEQKLSGINNRKLKLERELESLTEGLQEFVKSPYPLLSLKEKDLGKSRQELEQKKDAAEFQLATLEKSVKKLKVVPCGTQFPTCMFIKDSHNDALLIELQREKTHRLKAEFETVRLEHDKLKQTLARLIAVTESSIAVQKTKIEATKSILEQVGKEDVQGIKNKIQKLIEDKLVIQSELSAKKIKLEFSAKEIELHKEKLSNLKNVDLQLNQAMSLQQKLSNNIAVLTAQLEKNKDLKQQLEEAETQLKIWEMLNAACHRTGCPSILLAENLPRLNTKLESILSHLLDFSVAVELDPRTGALEINLIDSKGYRKVEQGSGMERMMASLALRVALIELSTLPKSSFFFIDEGFNALDSENLAACQVLLQNIQSMFRQVFVITHMDDFKDQVSMSIEIEIEGERSKLLA